MRSLRFFVPGPLALGTLELPEETAHHIVRVLRLTVGTRIQLFDGSGREFSGTLSATGRKSATLHLDETLQDAQEPPLSIHLGQALSRGERMDWAIQKATELGVASITPLFTERTEVRLNEERQQKRQQHWQQVAISACEQSGRTRIPQIHPPLELGRWLQQQDANLKLVLHPTAEDQSRQATAPRSLAVLIGPEGGLSEAEVVQATEQGFAPWQLGPRILRTETAPVVALSLAQYLWGDLQS